MYNKLTPETPSVNVKRFLTENIQTMVLKHLFLWSVCDTSRYWNDNAVDDRSGNTDSFGARFFEELL